MSDEETKRKKHTPLHVSNFENVPILDDDIVHVYGLELAEVLGEGDEVNRGPFMELKELWIIIVPLPPMRGKLPFQHAVRCNHFISWYVNQHFTTATGTLQRVPSGVFQSNHSVFENPNAGHFLLGGREDFENGDGVAKRRGGETCVYIGERGD